MRIAFTSCFSAQIFPTQPVWDQIRAAKPTALVLTGDSIYIDEAPGAVHPKQRTDFDFLVDVAAKYRAQLAQTQFRALIREVPTYAIWDDHDFLWNESYEERAIRRKKYTGLIRATRALFNAFRQDLEQGVSFPASDSDPRLWRADEPAPGYRVATLERGALPPVLLHLTDGRSWRVDDDLLGAAQRQQMASAVAAAPHGSLHLVASGSVVESHKGDRWSRFNDFAWLKDLARQHRMAALSGDIHANAFHAIDLRDGAGGTVPKFSSLFDFTASGAAIRRLVGLGSACCNWGLLDIHDTTLTCQWFEFGKPSTVGPVSVAISPWAVA